MLFELVSGSPFEDEEEHNWRVLAANEDNEDDDETRTKLYINLDTLLALEEQTGEIGAPYREIVRALDRVREENW